MSAYGGEIQNSRPRSARSEPIRAGDGDEFAEMTTELKKAKQDIRHICHHFNRTIDDYQALQQKHKKLQTDHAKMEIDNRLLCSEVNDLNNTVTAIEDQMQDQYHESLELKTQNAELRERNAHLEKEVLRLKKMQTEEIKKAPAKINDSTTKRATPYSTTPFIEDRQTKASTSSTYGIQRKPVPSTYQPSWPLPSKRIFRHYAQSTASSRQRSTTPPGASAPLFRPSGRVPAPSTPSIRPSSAASSAFSTITSSATINKRKKPAQSLLQRDSPIFTNRSSSGAASSSSTRDVSTTTSVKANHKRTLSPRMVDRSPAPDPVWINLAVVTDETRARVEQKKFKKRMQATVEDEEHMNEVAKPHVKKGGFGIKSKAFL